MIKAREYVRLSSEAAFAVSGDLRVLAWNKSAEYIFGLAAADAVGCRCSDVVAAELPSGEPLCGPDCHGGICFRNGAPFSVDDCSVSGSGQEPIRVSMSSLIVPADEPGDPSRTRALIFVHPLDGTGAKPAMPLPLHIRMLGRFSVSLNECPVSVETWQRKAAVKLLKIMAMHPGHLMVRDRLVELLWPGVDEKHGRDRLKVAVYSLRQLLGRGDLVEHADEAYGLRTGAVLLDVAVFERLVAEGIRHVRRFRADDAVTCLGDALRLYRGDYLEDDPYEEWCAEDRMRLRELYFEAAEYLAETLFEQHRYGEAGRVCNDALDRESCREVFHRMRMECLLAQGRAEEAERQYRRCRETLDRELGVEPLPETRRLAERIRATRT
ncbi:MAG: PAS domain-containing protein [Rhodobacteraceae bacterium]|nr:PAS domain-containing protein [Paracoccaceae bacterium]